MATINGTDAANNLDGTASNDTINGQGGNDTIYGEQGNDRLLGGDHDDLIFGGISDAQRQTIDSSFSTQSGHDGFDSQAGWNVQRDERKLADIDGDGNADIIAFGANSVSIAYGQNDGMFGTAFDATNTFTTNNGSWTAARHERDVADVNGDGLADLVGFGDFGVTVSLSNGDGTFQNAISANSDFGTQTGWSSQTDERKLGDINGDGKADIIGFASDGVFVALGQENGTFGQAVIATNLFTSVNGGWRVDRHERDVADVNGDGFDDLVGFGEYGVTVSLSNGDGTFQNAIGASSEFGRQAGWSVQRDERKLEDVNGDGRADIIGFGADGVFIAYGQGDGTFGAAVNATNSFTTNNGSWTAARHERDVADINGDGVADLVGFGDFGVTVAVETNFDEGNNFLNGENGNDTLTGGNGNDTIEGGRGNDVIFGGYGDDFLEGEPGSDTLYGGFGNDRLEGGSNSDTLFGGAGNDTLDGGGGVDRLEGGRGDDIYFINDFDDVIVENASSGLDRVNTTSHYRLSDYIEVLTARSDDGLRLSGNLLDNTIEGRDGADTLFGSAGEDFLVGGNGNDFLDGGFHNDILRGGEGADILFGDQGADNLRGGGDSDQFRFTNKDSGTEVGDRDVISDFEVGIDHIDLTIYDTRYDVTYIGDQAFTGVAGQVRVENLFGDGGQITDDIILIDETGNGIADSIIEVEFASGTDLSASDFLF